MKKYKLLVLGAPKEYCVKYVIAFKFIINSGDCYAFLDDEGNIVSSFPVERTCILEIEKMK